ncbi:MAG: hypothetical protein V3T70_08220 [Phycisphaerae bacterium]
MDGVTETIRNRIVGPPKLLDEELELLRAKLEKLEGRACELETLGIEQRRAVKELNKLGNVQTGHGKKLHDLEKRQLIDEKNSETWKFVAKIAVPSLAAAVIALFGWVWNSHSGLVRVD